MKCSERSSRSVSLGVVILFYFACCSLVSAGDFAPPQFVLGATKQKKNDAPRAQSSGTTSDRQACRTLKKLLPKAFFVNQSRFFGSRSTETRLTTSGIAFYRKGKRDVEINYADVQRPAERGTNILPEQCVRINAKKMLDLCFELEKDPMAMAEADELASAINQLVSSAHQGHPSSCVSVSSTDKAEFDLFSEQTAAWRILSPKPPLSDEVNKKRLMAEDAISRKDMNAAVAYYEAGVAIDPTWAQGWYNAAVIYAEQFDYSDAAYCMKHYLILVPGAPDAATAKEKVLFWEAKAEEVKTP